MEKNIFDNQELLELFAKTGDAHNEDSASARTAFAASLALPLRKEIEKNNIARTLFWVDELTADAQPVYELDIKPISAYVLPRIGSAPQNIVGVEDINVSTFEVTSSIEWKLQLARQKRINIVQRKALSLKNAITDLENKAAWELIRGAVQDSRTVESTATKLTKTVYNEGFQMMQSMDEYNPDVILLNAKRAGDVRDWGSVDLDPTTQREIWKKAGLGNIWGADIIIWNELPDDEVWYFDTSKLGVMPVRTKFVTYDDPTAIPKYRQRILGYEEIGLAVFDTNAIVKVELS